MYIQNSENVKEIFTACGIIDRTKPTTGVFNCNNLEHIYDEIDDAIDLTYEHYCRFECEDGNNDGNKNDCIDCHYMNVPYNAIDDYNLQHESMGDTEDLIGFIYNEETGEYTVDREAEFSAILRTGSNVLQVVRSVWYLTGGLCSPCYPGQVDADSETDDILAYSVPPSLVGFDDSAYGEDIVKASQKLRERIYLLEHREMIQEFGYGGLKVWNRADYEAYRHSDRNDRHAQNYYHVILSAHNSGLVVAGNTQEALDIGIDHATDQQWEGLFLTQDDIGEIVSDCGQEAFDCDYISGGNEGRYLSSLNVDVREFPYLPPLT